MVLLLFLYRSSKGSGSVFYSDPVERSYFFSGVKKIWFCWRNYRCIHWYVLRATAVLSILLTLLKLIAIWPSCYPKHSRTLIECFENLKRRNTIFNNDNNSTSMHSNFNLILGSLIFSLVTTTKSFAPGIWKLVVLFFVKTVTQIRLRKLLRISCMKFPLQEEYEKV